MFIEEEINQKSSCYDSFYGRYFQDWSEKFQNHKDEMKYICSKIDAKERELGQYYPLKKDLFKCLELTPLSKVKVVIWGQDPYPNLNSERLPLARGYSFGVSKKDNIPKTVHNIYKELNQEMPGFVPPTHGDLTGWTKQGVLLMNSSLCYSPKNPKAFPNLWLRFVNIIIDIINENVPNCIHLLWGKRCEGLADNINSREVYIASHPSPLSAYQGFFGCNHFIKTNITLQRQGKTPIDWSNL